MNIPRINPLLSTNKRRTPPSSQDTTHQGAKSKTKSTIPRAYALASYLELIGRDVRESWGK
jgi:hypothetical protein